MGYQNSFKGSYIFLSDGKVMEFYICIKTWKSDGILFSEPGNFMEFNFWNLEMSWNLIYFVPNKNVWIFVIVDLEKSWNFIFQTWKCHGILSMVFQKMLWIFVIVFYRDCIYPGKLPFYSGNIIEKLWNFMLQILWEPSFG